MAGSFKRSHRVIVILVCVLIVAAGSVASELHRPTSTTPQPHTNNLALTALDKLAGKDRAPADGYSREQFATG